MPARQILPDKQTLQHWIEDEGLTHQQCADRIYELTGEKVGRSAISVAVHRYGLSKAGARYPDYIPWRVSMYHIRAYPLRMLRLLGRRDTKGIDTLNEREQDMLNAWLTMLNTENAIVGYDPDDDQGVHYIDAKYKDHDGPAPIRIKQLHLTRTD